MNTVYKANKRSNVRVKLEALLMLNVRQKAQISDQFKLHPKLVFRHEIKTIHVIYKYLYNHQFSFYRSS